MEHAEARFDWTRFFDGVGLIARRVVAGMFSFMGIIEVRR